MSNSTNKYSEEYINDSLKSRALYSEEVKTHTDGSVKKFIKRLLNRDETIIEDIDIMYSDALYEDELRKSKNGANSIKNMSLSFFNNVSYEPCREDIGKIFGIINNRNIKIIRIIEYNYVGDNAVPSKYSYDGIIDGYKLDPKEAEDIFKKYYEVAKVRSNRLNKVKEEKNIPNKKRQIIETRKQMVNKIITQS